MAEAAHSVYFAPISTCPVQVTECLARPATPPPVALPIQLAPGRLPRLLP